MFKKHRLKEEDGQALFETALVLPILMVMLIGVILVGPLAYVRLAIDAASYDCVTQAVEAVSSESQAHYQGRVAALQTIRGYRINPTHATVNIWADGGWDRGARMVCRVSYDFKASKIPGASLLFAGGDRRLTSETSLSVETLKSDWW